MLMALQCLSGQTNNYIIGADLSALPAIENGGGQYFANGEASDAIELFKSNSFNTVRLRLWHTPANANSSLEQVKTMARRVKQAGMKLLLNFHYSDWWADPAHQEKPDAWEAVTGPVLADSVYNYTYSVVLQLKAQGTPPDIVQIGNETSCGMLWYSGYVCNEYDTGAQWQRYVALYTSGKLGVEHALLPDDSAQIMLHLPEVMPWFLGRFFSYGGDFDLFGVSYYPWWHGGLDQFRQDLEFVIDTYNKPIVVVETAYPWTLDYFDDQHNLVGETSQLLNEFPATPQGQYDYLDTLNQIVKALPGGKGLGLVYWEPDWITAPDYSSPWENLALFDSSGQALPALSVFDTTVTQIAPSAVNSPVDFSLKIYPNPFNNRITLLINIKYAAQMTLSVYDVKGRIIQESQPLLFSKGRQTQQLNMEHQASGIYFVSVSSARQVVTQKVLLIK
jgi:arabinogalactan endo-1,4-beta-galactosidase